MNSKSRIVSFVLAVIVLFGAMGFTVKGVLKDVKLGLDLQGGFEVLYEVEPLKEGQKITQSIVADTTTALSKRIDAFGVSEPSIQVEGENRIRVQLAGIDDQSSAREMLSSTANLTFRDVNDNLLLDGSDLKEGGLCGFLRPTKSTNRYIDVKRCTKICRHYFENFSNATRSELTCYLDGFC